MQKQARDLVIRASERWSLPMEATAGLSRLELVGNSRLSVENHRGVGAFGPGRMELLTPDGVIEVRGERLTLLTMNRQELVVGGVVHSLTLTTA